MTASPISDLNPILMAVGAVVTIASKTGVFTLVLITIEFIVDYCICCLFKYQYVFTQGAIG